MDTLTFPHPGHPQATLSRAQTADEFVQQDEEDGASRRVRFGEQLSGTPAGWM